MKYARGAKLPVIAKESVQSIFQQSHDIVCFAHDQRRATHIKHSWVIGALPKPLCDECAARATLPGLYRIVAD
jgi:hypothetical protein